MYQFKPVYKFFKEAEYLIQYSDWSTNWTTEEQLLDSLQGQERPLLQSVEEGFRSYPASCSVVIGVLSPKAKRSVCEANHSPPSSAKVKNVSCYISKPDYAYVQGTNLVLPLEVTSKF